MDKPPSAGPKIAIIRNAYQSDFGGGERMPVNLGRQLSELGCGVVIISRSRKLLAYAQSQNLKAIRGWWWSQQNWSGFRAIFVPIYLAWQAILTLGYLALFLRLRPQTVHAQSKDDFIAATVAGRLIGAEVVWSDHADLKYIYQNLSVWYKNPVGKLVWWCSKLASCIVLTSQNDKKQIEQAAGRKLSSKYRIIYNGVLDQPQLLNKYRPGQKIIFAATSRLVTSKGVGELIDAFKQLLLKHPDCELWLFGEGPEAEKFHQQAASSPRIMFKGYPNNALEQVAQADIFVHPSYLEGFSLSLVEAAMLAKPIIACRVGGNIEIIKDGSNGFLVPAQDVPALLSAMERLAKDKDLRQKFSAKSRLEYENRFDLKKIVREDYLKIYE